MKKEKFRKGIYVIFITTIFVLAFFSIADNAYAEWDYYTYSGYNAAVEAWKRVSLIFSHGAFKALMASAVVLGALVMLYATILRSAVGVRSDILRNWMVPVGIGMVIGSVFIFPKDRLVIYDEVLQRGPYTVDNVPKILALTAGLTNKIERAFIDIVDTTAIDPSERYLNNAGGIGYSAVKYLHSYWRGEALSADKKYLLDTYTQYVSDCVLYVIASSGGSLINIQRIMDGQMSPSQMIELAKHPSIYTTIWDPNGIANEGVSCEYAGTQLQSYLATELNPNLPGSLANTVVRAVCSMAGYAEDIGSLNRCSSLVMNIIQDTSFSLGLSSPPSNIGYVLHASLLSHILYEVTLKGSPDEALRILATSQTMSSLWGLGEHANSWIIVLKEALRAFAIAISPFILLFAVTPIAGRALSTVLGLFVWITCWGVIDAVMFTFGRTLALEYAPALGKGIHYGWGTAIAFTMPGYTTKIIAIFGALRWAGLMLSTVITSMLVRFGGTMLALVSGQIASLPMAAGQSYGQAVMRSPESLFQGEIIPKASFANAALAGGGIGSLSGGMIRMGASDMMATSAVGNMYSVNTLTQAKMAHGRMNVIRGLGIYTALGSYPEESFIHKESFDVGGGVASYKKFTEGLTAPPFGRSLSYEDMNLLWNKTGGNVGKAYQILTGMHFLKERGKSLVSPFERQVFETGDFASQVALTERYLDTGALEVTTTESGDYYISFKAGSFMYAGLYDRETGQLTGVVDIVYPQKLALGLGSIGEIKKSLETVHKTDIVRDLEKIDEKQIEDAKTRRFISSVLRSQENIFETMLRQEASKDKELSNFLKEIEKTQHDFHLGVNASVGGKMLKVIKASLNAGYNHSFAVGSEKTIQVNESLRQKVLNLYGEATLEAIRRVTGNEYSDAHTLREVESYLEKIGAKYLASYVETERYLHSDKATAEKSLLVEFTLWRAEKRGLTPEEASLSILREMSVNPEKVQDEAHQFLKEKFLEGWEAKIYEKGESIQGRFEGIEKDVYRGLGKGSVESPARPVEHSVKQYAGQPDLSQPSTNEIQKKFKEVGDYIDSSRESLKSSRTLLKVPLVGGVVAGFKGLGVIGNKPEAPPNLFSPGAKEPPKGTVLIPTSPVRNPQPEGEWLKHRPSSPPPKNLAQTFSSKVE